MRIVLITALLLTLLACTNAPKDDTSGTDAQNPPEINQGWFAATKGKILADYLLGTDSTAEAPIEQGRFLQIDQFRRGELKARRIATLKKQTIYETIFSGGFELRREYCGNGQMAFEGIHRDGEFLGLSTWWHCNGNLRQQGWKYRSKLFGKWTWWREDGSVEKEENYGLMNYLDSLNAIGWGQ